ncbi:MAG: penicillin-insensitive murein endopeptidase [Candidatus Tectomicrobia bacterium]|nr:penicillin-insensitive murein endopeptidase [Candidatus Tectomicrobia bacterium]
MLATLWSPDGQAEPVTYWHTVHQPILGAPRIIGSYASGCLQGAQSLPSDGPGFRTMRRHRGRFFGHPALVRYIQELGRQVAEKNGGVLNISDLGQARGGPIPSGHRSHQTGLDVDIWFWLTDDVEPLAAATRETVSAPSMLTADAQGLNPQVWTSRQIHLLQTAAGFAAVERIFVNPHIKQALCKHFAGAAWLRKIRPWWGHDAHFHVRLRCPNGNPSCVKQAPPPSGDGCDATLAWWFTAEAQTPPKKDTEEEIKLPAACQAILDK